MTAAEAYVEARIRRILREGDTITHTRCMGCVEEHIFTRYGHGETSRWLCGKPTRDTIRMGGSRFEADDISFRNVTHINRVPIGVAEFAVEFADRLAEVADDGVADALNVFYLQDSRSYVGNDMLFWCEGGNSYTTDLRKAAVYSRSEAQAKHNARPTDIPWPKAYIDRKTRPAVDMQYVKRAEALKGSGITLQKPRKEKREVFKCLGCGRYTSERAVGIWRARRAAVLLLVAPGATDAA